MNTIVHAPSSPSVASLVRVFRDFVGGMHSGLTSIDPSEAMLLVAKNTDPSESSAVSGADTAILRVDAQRDRLRMQAWF